MMATAALGFGFPLATLTAAATGDIPDGMCRIVLEAHDVFGDGATGYQWILDPGHNTYNEEFIPGTDRYFGTYDAFELSLPGNAECRYPTETVVIDGEESLLVEAGVYDWMVVRPCDKGMMFPYGDYALVDDFEFLPGETYRITAEYRDGVKGPGDYVTLAVARDLALEELRIPLSGVGLGKESITVTVVNRGVETMSGAMVSYAVNGDAPVVEPLPWDVKAGESVNYTFNTKADFSAVGMYEVTAEVEVEGDMLYSNNHLSSTCRNMEASPLPYTCVFSDLGPDGFVSDWMQVDGNRDGNTWMYSEWIANSEGKMGVAACGGSYNGDRFGNDWLISRPLSIPAGKANISFTTRSVMDTQVEHVQVCVGTTPYPESMWVVAEYDVCTLDWIVKGLTFDVEADGIYYISFHAMSEKGYNIFIGDVNVAEGEFIGKPDIKLDRLLLPYSNCDLSADAKVGMRVTNNGTGALGNYTLSCSVNGEAVVATAFDKPLEPGETADLYIDRSVDFSAVGKYELELRLTAENVDETREAVVECFEPITEKPVFTSFTLQDNAGIWNMMAEGGWHYEAVFSDFSAQKHGLDYALLGRGISFSNPARVKLSYAAGGWDSSRLAIYFGKAGADIATYDKVFGDDDVRNEPKEVEFTVPVESAGNYSIVIADEGEGSSRSFIRLNEILISEVMPHDLAVRRVQGPVSAYMPASQLGEEGSYSVIVENRGSETLSGVRVGMYVDGERTGESIGPGRLSSGETAVIKVVGKLPAKKEGETLEVSFVAESDVEDDYAADNTYALGDVTVTETQRSTENISDLVNGTGNNGEPLAVGNVYEFASDVDLTSVTVGLCPADESTSMNALADIALNIYLLDEEDKILRAIYSERRVRGEGGLVTFDFPDMRLAVGDYYFEVEQLSRYNMGLAFEPVDGGICWQRQDDVLTPVEAGCALCIRAEFASDAVVYAHDAWAKEISEPALEEALFGADENVKAEVRNNGYENAAFDVELIVDGCRVATQEVSLFPYESAVLDFAGVDLSEAGPHSLELRTVLTGDDNPSNDCCTKSVVSVEEADPYVMDFESCNDFDAAGDRFNPRWTTIDRVGVRTTFFWLYEHRHRGDACGFMAFNPSATVPSCDETPLKNFEPYAGERMGVAFTFNPYNEGGDAFTQADTWIISPKLRLGDGSTFDFYVRTRDLEGMEAQLEPYRVLVSETDDAPESFSVLGEDVRLASVDDWEHISVDLGEYDGKNVHVAIQYIGKPFINTCLMIDDLSVRTDLTGVAEVETDRIPSVTYDRGLELVKADSSSASAVLEVYSAEGLMVARSGADANGGCTVSVRGLRPGVYVAKVRSENGDTVLKFVVR